MDEVWTSGIWTAKPGRGDEFVAAWHEFAEWTADAHHPDRRAWLLRDRENPDVYVSIGPWPNLAAVDSWRADPLFRERVGRIRGLLESFEPRTLDPILEVLETGEVQGVGSGAARLGIPSTR
jgi:quinol monooxygenase YgiN